MAKTAVCHPNRTHLAKGLCGPCYRRNYYVTHKAFCHPTKRVYCRGLCHVCFYNLPENIDRYEQKSERSRNWNRNNKPWRRNYQLQRSFGITAEQYNLMFQEQHGLCYLCGKSQEINGRRLSVDHCHKTTRVRRLLCDQCNIALGYVETSLANDWLDRAKSYLIHYNLDNT